jgi:hypothetical protein
MHWRLVEEIVMNFSDYLLQVFKTNLLFSPAVSLDAPEGNKFLFSNEDKLVQNSWPSSMKKLLGCGSLTTQTGKKHKYEHLRNNIFDHIQFFFGVG